MLSEDDRFEVLEYGLPHGMEDDVLLVDVLVAAGVSSNDLPAEPPAVVLSEDTETTAPGGPVRAVLPMNASAAEIVAAIVAAAADEGVLKETLRDSATVIRDSSGLRIHIQDEKELDSVIAALRKANGKVVSVQPVRQSLEDLFVD